jgi:hypothetical protein
MLIKCNLLWVLSPYLEIKCLVIHVVLCQSLSLILGLQRSQCRWGIFLSLGTNLCSNLVTIHVLNNYHGYSHQGYTRKNKVNLLSILSVYREQDFHLSSSDWMIFGYVFYLWEVLKRFIIFGHANVTRLTSFHHKENLKCHNIWNLLSTVHLLTYSQYLGPL